MPKPVIAPVGALVVLVVSAVGCGSSTPSAGSGSAGTSAGSGSNVAGSTSGGASAGIGSGAATGSSTGSIGGAGAASGASAGASGSGTAGATTGAASTGSTGSGAAAGAGSSGSASGQPGGDAGDGAAPGGDGGAASGLGVQGPTGTAGDGMASINPPYVVPPESMGLFGGATAGTLTAPALYASKTVYPGIKFQYSIYVPSQYQKGKPAALMIFLDGREWITTPGSATTVAWTDQGGWNANTVLDNMIHAGDIPVTIAIFIDPGTMSGKFIGSGADNQQRSVEYDHPDDKYSQFTLTELLPDVVFSAYDIVQDPDGWCPVGHSSGGIAVFNMAFLHPDKFHKTFTFSASFPNTGGVWPAKINTLPLEPIRIHLLSSPNDLTRAWYDTNNTAAADLMAKGYHYQYIIDQSMHFPTPGGVQDFPNGLRWMWRGYKLPWYP